LRTCHFIVCTTRHESMVTITMRKDHSVVCRICVASRKTGLSCRQRPLGAFYDTPLLPRFLYDMTTTLFKSCWPKAYPQGSSKNHTDCESSIETDWAEINKFITSPHITTCKSSHATAVPSRFHQSARDSYDVRLWSKIKIIFNLPYGSGVGGSSYWNNLTTIGFPAHLRLTDPR